MTGLRLRLRLRWCRASSCGGSKDCHAGARLRPLPSRLPLRLLHLRLDLALSRVFFHSAAQKSRSRSVSISVSRTNKLIACLGPVWILIDLFPIVCHRLLVFVEEWIVLVHANQLEPGVVRLGEFQKCDPRARINACLDGMAQVFDRVFRCGSFGGERLPWQELRAEAIAISDCTKTGIFIAIRSTRRLRRWESTTTCCHSSRPARNTACHALLGQAKWVREAGAIQGSYPPPALSR